MYRRICEDVVTSCNMNIFLSLEFIMRNCKTGKISHTRLFMLPIGQRFQENFWGKLSHALLPCLF